MDTAHTRQHRIAALLIGAALCTAGGCSWTDDDATPGAANPETSGSPGASSTASEGGAAEGESGAGEKKSGASALGASPVRVGTAAQQNNGRTSVATVRAGLVPDMFEQCGNRTCVTIVAEPADETCLYVGSEPPWGELVDPATMTIVLLGDCSVPRPVETEPPLTEPPLVDPDEPPVVDPAEPPVVDPDEPPPGDSSGEARG